MDATEEQANAVTNETFPKQIVIRREQDKDESYLLAYESAEELNSENAGETVAVYELVATRKFKVTKELAPPL